MTNHDTRTRAEHDKSRYEVYWVKTITTTTTNLCTFVLSESIDDDAVDDVSLDCFDRLSVTCWSPDDLRLTRDNGLSTSLRPTGFS